MTATDPAVQAAAEALLRTGSLPLDTGERAFAAEVAVAAARQAISAEVRAGCRHSVPGLTCDYCNDAARIAEGGTR